MLKELSEDLNRIKKIQSEMKDTLIEIRPIYRETTGEWLKLIIKPMTWNIKKQKTIITTRRKKESKKNRTV